MINSPKHTYVIFIHIWIYRYIHIVTISLLIFLHSYIHNKMHLMIYSWPSLTFDVSSTLCPVLRSLPGFINRKELEAALHEAFEAWIRFNGSEIRRAPAEVGWLSSCSHYLVVVLAPSNRWLALRFLIHQQYRALFWVYWFTLQETNIAPENGWLEDEISFRDGLFGWRYVSSWESLSCFFCLRQLGWCFFILPGLWGRWVFPCFFFYYIPGLWGSCFLFLEVSDSCTGSTIRTLLHGKINPKNWQVLTLGDVGFLLFF